MGITENEKNCPAAPRASEEARVSSQLLDDFAKSRDRRLRVLLQGLTAKAKPQRHWDSILEEFGAVPALAMG